MATSIEFIQLAAQHARTTRLAVGPFDHHIIPVSASKHGMMAALEAAELEMLCTLQAIPEEQRTSTQVCGRWHTQELLAHLADWDVYFGAWLEQLCGGRPNELFFDKDETRFNDWLQAQRAGQTWETIWSDFRANRQAIHQKLSSVSEEAFLEKQDAPFGTVYHCAWSALEHYLDHAAGIRRQLNLPLPDNLLDFQGPYTG